MDTVILDVGPDQIRNDKASKSRNAPQLFVSYLFGDDASRNMRQQVDSILQTKGKFRVVDGTNIPEGDWAEQIRKRMSKSKCVLLDLTGPSREILFEYGFAGNKPTILCARNVETRTSLPRWLSAATIQAYEGANLVVLADNVHGRLIQQGRSRLNQRKTPIPGDVVWLQSRDSEWATPLQTRVANRARELGLRVSVVFPEELRSFLDVRDFLGAQFVFGCVDGGAQDYASHFFTGDVASRKTVGQGDLFARKAIVIAKDFNSNSAWIADSIYRLPRESVSIPTSEAELWDVVDGAFRKFKRTQSSA